MKRIIRVCCGVALCCSVVLSDGCGKKSSESSTSESKPSGFAALDKDAVIAGLIDGMVAIPGKNYKMGKYEVTQAQWYVVMDGKNPSKFIGVDNPVESIVLDDCDDFLKKLNALPAVKASGLVFRLPTMYEWDYASRAQEHRQLNGLCRLADGTEVTRETLGEIAWFADNSDKKTHPVGQKKPNAFGLYDMFGNVYEWVEDAPYATGGSWDSRPRNIEGGLSGSRSPQCGFRLCASVNPAADSKKPVAASPEGN